MSRRVLMWVQHLVGVGHQRRSAALARALTEGGIQVCYVTGGMPVQGLDPGHAERVQLPPARSLDMRYHTLVDERGVAVDDAWRARRRDALAAVVTRFRPHAVITETWPFGRGLLRFELEPLMADLAARSPRPLLISSVRDIVERRRETAKYTRMAERVRRHFDAVLVHSDPALVPFADSFPPYPDIAARVWHTGYVSTRAPRARRAPCPEGPVVVSAGGGFFGERLLACAVRAAALAREEGRHWHVLAGPNLPAARFDALRDQAVSAEVTEEAVRDFHRLLDACAVSVSQGGYNTVVDLLAARVPSVIVPYEDEREREQAVRAEHLAVRGLATVVPYPELEPARLAEAVARTAAGSGMPEVAVDLDGAGNSARLLARWLHEPTLLRG